VAPGSTADNMLPRTAVCRCGNVRRKLRLYHSDFLGPTGSLCEPTRWHGPGFRSTASEIWL